MVASRRSPIVVRGLARSAGEPGAFASGWPRTSGDARGNRRGTRIGGLTPTARRGFTLVELLVVIGIFVVLTVMTVGAINLSVTSERVRGAARQIQSKIEGARDRAIYSSRKNPDNVQPVGVRLLVDENEPSICTSLVYIQSPGNDASVPTASGSFNPGVQSVNPDEVDAAWGGLPLAERYRQRAVVGVGTSWRTLYERGLIGVGSRITIDGQTLSIHPKSFPVLTESEQFNGVDFNDGGANGEVLFTVEEPPNAPGGAVPPNNRVSNPQSFSIPLSPDIMPDEDALQLPRGTCIDLETSHLPDGWLTFNTSTGAPQFSNRMDILFSAKGTVVGDAAASGIIHLHVVDVADALENAPPGSPTLLRDTNGDMVEEYPVTEFPVPPNRNGDELGITIFTKSGRTITHPIRFHDLHHPGISPDDGIYYPPMGDLTSVLGSGVNGALTGVGVWDDGNTPYDVDDVVAPRVYNGLIFRVITSNSTTLNGEPQWNLAPGGLTQGDRVIWQSIKHDVWALGLEGEVAK